MSKTISEIKKYILDSIEHIEPVDEKEIQDKKKIKNFLVLHPNNFYDVSNYRGHITVSALILDNDLILTVKNKYTDKWDVIKNHCEKDELPFETIIKNIKATTELSDFKTKNMDEDGNPAPYYCNVYEVDLTPDDPTDKDHTHLDLLYIFETKLNKDQQINNEKLKWLPKNEAMQINDTIRKVLMKQMGKIII